MKRCFQLFKHPELCMHPFSCKINNFGVNVISLSLSSSVSIPLSDLRFYLCLCLHLRSQILSLSVCMSLSVGLSVSLSVSRFPSSLCFCHWMQLLVCMCLTHALVAICFIWGWGGGGVGSGGEGDNNFWSLDLCSYWPRPSLPPSHPALPTGPCCALLQHWNIWLWYHAVLTNSLSLNRKWPRCLQTTQLAAIHSFEPVLFHHSVGLRRPRLCRKYLCISGCKDGFHGDKCSDTCSPSGRCQRCDRDSGLCSACYSNSNLTPPSCTGRSCIWHRLHAQVGHVSDTPLCTVRWCFWHCLHAPLSHVSDSAFMHCRAMLLTPLSLFGRRVMFLTRLHAPVGHVSDTALMYWYVMFLAPPSCTGMSCFWHLIHAPVEYVSDMPSCTGRSFFWHRLHAPVGHVYDTAFMHP